LNALSQAGGEISDGRQGRPAAEPQGSIGSGAADARSALCLRSCAEQPVGFNVSLALKDSLRAGCLAVAVKNQRSVFGDTTFF
jgi:hypothetical protein